MMSRCYDCGRIYNDVECWTICPHGPLAFAPDAYDPKTDTIRGFNHPDDLAIDVAPPVPWWRWPAFYLATFAIGLLLGWWLS